MAVFLVCSVISGNYASLFCGETCLVAIRVFESWRLTLGRMPEDLCQEDL